MSEANVWNKLRTNMKWDEATRHEDKLQRGIADVSFCLDGHHGWMELKHLNDWPARASTVVRCPHFTVDQIEFLEAKGRGAGHTWLFMQVGGDHLLFAWNNIRVIGESTKQGLIDASHSCWIGRRLDYGELLKSLKYCAQYKERA